MDVTFLTSLAIFLTYYVNLPCEGRTLKLNSADGNLAQFVQPLLANSSLLSSFPLGVTFLNCWREIDGR